MWQNQDRWGKVSEESDTPGFMKKGELDHLHVLTVASFGWCGWRVLAGRLGCWGVGQSFRSCAFVSASCESWGVCLGSHSNAYPHLTFTLPWLISSVVSVTLGNVRERCLVSRGFCFLLLFTFSLSFHYHLVGRRRSLCFGTHSLHTVGKSLNKNTFLW